VCETSQSYSFRRSPLLPPIAMSERRHPTPRSADRALEFDAISLRLALPPCDSPYLVATSACADLSSVVDDVDGAAGVASTAVPESRISHSARAGVSDAAPISIVIARSIFMIFLHRCDNTPTLFGSRHKLLCRTSHSQLVQRSGVTRSQLFWGRPRKPQGGELRLPTSSSRTAVQFEQSRNGADRERSKGHQRKCSRRRSRTA